MYGHDLNFNAFFKVLQDESRQLKKLMNKAKGYVDQSLCQNHVRSNFTSRCVFLVWIKSEIIVHIQPRQAK